MQIIASTSRARPPCICSLARASPSKTFVNQTPTIWPSVDRIPMQKEPLTTVSDVLKAAGRNMKQYEDKFDSWETLFGADGPILKRMGLPCKDRRCARVPSAPKEFKFVHRYLMRQLQWYRLGFHPGDMGTKLKPKKKIRGLGDRVQKGKEVPEKKLFRLSHRRSIRRSRNIRKRNIPKYSPLRSDKDKQGQRYGQSIRYRADMWATIHEGLSRHRNAPAPAEMRRQ